MDYIPGVEHVALVDDAKAVVSAVQKHLMTSWDIMLTHPNAPYIIAAVLGLVLVYLFVVACVTLARGSVKKGKQRMPTHWQKMMVEDAIQDGLDEAFFKGKISGRTRKHYLSEIGRKAELPGLLVPKKVRKLHPYRIKAIKDAIQDRMKNLYSKFKPVFPADAPKAKPKLKLVSSKTPKKEEPSSSKEAALRKYAAL